MARYTGPVFKKARRYGFSILETGKEFSKGKQRSYAPGQHGQRRVKLSDYGLHLHEKQKLRFIYGVNERQFRNTFKRAAKMKGVAGVNFMQMLESRLDNVVYRMGFAETRRQSRQLVNHNHFTLNGKKANIASMHVNVGDLVTLSKKMENNQQIKDAMTNRQIAPWMERAAFSGKVTRLPERSELNKNINEALVVEYYSK